MIRLLLILAFSVLFGLPGAQSQDKCCGMNHEETELLTKRLIANKKNIAEYGAFRSAEIVYVPLKFHIVSNNAGFGGIKETEIFEQVCRLNEDYLDQEVHFFIEGEFNYINSTPAFEDPRSGGGQLQLANGKNQNFGRVNIFVTSVAGEIANVGTSAGYYSPQFDWIVVRINEVSNSTETLTHELGHFFTLLHTFSGWDFSPYDPAVHSNPAPEFTPSPYTTARTENMDRTGTCKNCDNAGDRLCDTNPDYLLSQEFSNGNCDYSGDIMDPCGVLVDPPKENYMSYFFGCNQEFSQGQKDLIRADINTRLNQEGTLNRVFQPDNLNPVTDPVVAVSPAIDETLDYNNIVHLEWEPVANATKYIVDIDRFPSFNTQNERFFTSNNGTEVLDLRPNDDYYWRVYAYNESSTCLGWSETFTFNTGEGVTSISGISSLDTWQIMPNPVSTGSKVDLQISVQNKLDAIVNVRDINGRQISSSSENLEVGINSLTLETNDLLQGIYIVSIETAEGITSKKLVVNN